MSIGELLMTVGWVLVATAAGFAGNCVGKRFIRGRISTEQILVLTLILVLVLAWVSICLLKLSINYISWIAFFIGSVAAGALQRD